RDREHGGRDDRGHGARSIPHRRHRRRPRHPAARTHPGVRLAGGRLPRPHRRFRGVPLEGDLMTTLTAQRPHPTRPDATEHRRTFAHALHSEWIKLATVRSTWWSIGIVAVLTIGIAVLVAASMDVPGFEPIQAVVSPIQFTMLLAGILGAISVTGEYSS